MSNSCKDIEVQCVVNSSLINLLDNIFILSNKIRYLFWKVEQSDAERLLNIIRSYSQKLDKNADQLAKFVVKEGGEIPASFAGLSVQSSISHDMKQLEPVTALRKIGSDHLKIKYDIDSLVYVLGDNLEKEPTKILEKILCENTKCARLISKFCNSAR